MGDPIWLAPPHLYVPPVLPESMRFAVNLAISTQRPLLVTGPPGSGKNGVADSAASDLKLPIIRYLVRKSSTVADLLYTYDAISRFNDVQRSPVVRDATDYIQLGCLGAAFVRSLDAQTVPQLAGFGLSDGPKRTVVSIMDADCGSENFLEDLIDAIERRSFQIRETGQTIQANPEYLPIVIVTVTSDQQLSQRVRRHFIEAEMPEPSAEQLMEVLRNRFAEHDPELMGEAVRLFTTEPYPKNMLADFVAVAMHMKARPGSPDWISLRRTMLDPKKVHTEPADGGNRRPGSLLQVFLSHSSINKTAVRDLSNELREVGLNTWMDEANILAGKEWEREIVEGVRSSDAVIVCLSRKALSRGGFFEREMELAVETARSKRDQSAFIIPAKLDECELPAILANWQGVDLFAKGGSKKLIRSLVWLAVTLSRAGR